MRFIAGGWNTLLSVSTAPPYYDDNNTVVGLLCTCQRLRNVLKTEARPRLLLSNLKQIAMAPRITVSVDSEVGADKRVIARTSNDPRVKKLIDHTVENGYVIIENAFSKAQVEETKAELARISNLEDAGPAVAHGRNSFEGFKTSRNFALLNKSKDFEKYAIHPDVLALNDHFLDPAYLLSLAHSISIQPGEDQQTIHQDDGYILVERPHPPFVTVRVCTCSISTHGNL